MHLSLNSMSKDLLEVMLFHKLSLVINSSFLHFHNVDIFARGLQSLQLCLILLVTTSRGNRGHQHESDEFPVPRNIHSDSRV